MQGRGYSTNESTTDTFVKTSHSMVKIRATLKERLNIITSSAHKETTIAARIHHENMVHNLVLQLDKYFDLHSASLIIQNQVNCVKATFTSSIR